MPNQSAQTYIPSTTDQVIAAGYHNGQGVVKGDKDLKTENILKGVEIFGVDGQDEPPSSASGTAVAAEVLAGKTLVIGIGVEITIPNFATSP